MDVMKKSKNIGLLMILLAFFSSCEKYDMVEFGEGGEINLRDCELPTESGVEV